MPELPEVETVRRSLKPHIVGKRIESVEVFHPKTVRFTPDFVQKLQNQTFGPIRRRAKLLMFSFEKMEEVMCAHLKMTGQFFYQKESFMDGGGHSLTDSSLFLPHKHTRVIFSLDDGSKLYFNDMRLFGYLKLVDRSELERVEAGYGIEPLTEGWNWDSFDRVFHNRKTNVKALLLNQSLVAGLGNIYVDEVCHLAGVRPNRLASSLSVEEKKKLFEGCEEILDRAVKLGGTTFQYYRDADGQRGKFSDELKVFAREGELCLRCSKEMISKIRVAGRGTHFCKTCQE